MVRHIRAQWQEITDWVDLLPCVVEEHLIEPSHDRVLLLVAPRVFPTHQLHIMQAQTVNSMPKLINYPTAPSSCAAFLHISDKVEVPVDYPGEMNLLPNKLNFLQEPHLVLQSLRPIHRGAHPFLAMLKSSEVACD